jgi:probable rRNA maturation factor
VTARPRAVAKVGVTGSLRRIAPAARFRRDLARLARLAAKRRGGPVDVSVALLSDADIATLHLRYLGRRGPTDVISFPLSAPFERRLVGALALGAETARREAASRGHAPYHELMLYVAHGLLHLLGHDDAKPADRERMRRAERELLEGAGLPAVYERSPARRRPR